MIDPGTAALINTGVSVISQILGGGVDTMKQQASCGLMLNSGQVERLSKATLAPLTTKFRTSVKRQVNGKATNGRTWQECVLARTLYPNQVNGPIANPDMIDYMPGVADDRGMVAPVVQAQASPYVVANPNTAAAAYGTAAPVTGAAAAEYSAPLKVVEKSLTQAAEAAGGDLLSNPLMLAAGALIVAVAVMK